MQTLYHFFRLIRPLNLLVITLTMGVFHVFIVEGQGWYYLNPDKFGLWIDYGGPFDLSNELVVYFFLIVTSTILIAAAGNIINDYFDVKADRINKPEKVVIGKYIKRRWAIILNWIFNSVAFVLAAYVAWKLNNIWLVVIPLVSINLLWFYSMYYKRKLFTGNLIIALLTGIVPVHVLLFHRSSFKEMIFITLIFAAYAFWLNLIREIIKDIADIKGDLRLGSTTLPIKYGIKNTKAIVIILYLIAIGPLFYYTFIGWNFIDFIQDSDASAYYFLYLISGCTASLILSLIIFFKFNSRKKYLLSSNLLKLAMLFGLLCPLFL